MQGLQRPSSHPKDDDEASRSLGIDAEPIQFNASDAQAFSSWFAVRASAEPHQCEVSTTAA